MQYDVFCWKQGKGLIPVDLCITKIRFIQRTEFLGSCLEQKSQGGYREVPLRSIREQTIELEDPKIDFDPVIDSFIINGSYQVRSFEVIN